MESSVYLWLVEAEDALHRMTRGVFRFAFGRLPAWAVEALLGTVGPVAVRLARVLAVFALWLAVVFGPAALAAEVGVPFWPGLGVAAWTALALAGSFWGRACLARKRAAEILVAELVNPNNRRMP